MAKFRVVSGDDAARFLYGNNAGRLRSDLDFLKGEGLVETHSLNLRRDGKSEDVRRFTAITLTKAGQQLVSELGALPDGQRTYSGLVKPREAEHDAQVYVAYQKEIEKVREIGGENVRVRLDFELKANVYRSAYQLRKTDPSLSMEDSNRLAAEQHNLPFVDGKVVVPDARLEYDLPTGGTGTTDIEVATAAYRRGHLAAKSRAGFKLYLSGRDVGRLGAAVQDDHDLMSEILDL